MVKGAKALEVWCQRATEGYPGVNVVNMSSSWRDGLAFCAIIHRYRPDLLDFHSLDRNDIRGNNALAFRLAEEKLGIAQLLDPEDMARCSSPDRLSILTYLSEYYHKLKSQVPLGDPHLRIKKQPDNEQKELNATAAEGEEKSSNEEGVGTVARRNKNNLNNRRNNLVKSMFVESMSFSPTASIQSENPFREEVITSNFKKALTISQSTETIPTSVESKATQTANITAAIAGSRHQQHVTAINPTAVAAAASQSPKFQSCLNINNKTTTTTPTPTAPPSKPHRVVSSSLSYTSVPRPYSSSTAFTNKIPLLSKASLNDYNWKSSTEKRSPIYSPPAKNEDEINNYYKCPPLSYYTSCQSPPFYSASPPLNINGYSPPSRNYYGSAASSPASNGSSSSNSSGSNNGSNHNHHHHHHQIIYASRASSLV